MSLNASMQIPETLLMFRIADERTDIVVTAQRLFLHLLTSLCQQVEIKTLCCYKHKFK